MTQTPPVQQTDIGAFLRELWLRLTSKSPTFFKVIQIIAGVIATLATIAQVVKSSDVALPPVVGIIANWTIAIAAVVAFIIAKLPTVDKDRKVTEGELPFTAKKVAQGKEPIH